MPDLVSVATTALSADSCLKTDLEWQKNRSER
jgi:hypothetical protein